jgi:DNA-directed RNA polymerase subunit RPC12/RpoP
MESKGFCICVHCGTKLPHQMGVPCREVTCPECGRKMLREGSYHHQLYLKKKGDNENENSSADKR